MDNETDAAVDIPVERARFRELFLGNPNYFGTMPQLELPVIFPLAASTRYERITCVGLQPQLNRVEAIVSLVQNTGFSGTLCSGGSREFVRFYVSYDGGATWTDLGSTSFPVYDTPGPRPLDYAVSLVAPVRHRLCFVTNQPILRAILSWNVDPTPNTPGFSPVWGNVVDVTIQPDGLPIIKLKDFVTELDLKLPSTALQVLDLEADIKVADPAPAYTLVEAHEAYRGDVEPHRYVFPHIVAGLQLQESPTLPLPPPGPDPAPSSPLPFTLPFELKKLDIDLSEIIAKLFDTGDGDTSYEELDCIGYDAADDVLMGVLTVKRSNGYSGGPCTSGSLEYVRFWIDWGDGLGWQLAGTSAVRVHDFAVLPPGGLKYALYQPISSSARRKDCVDGPVQPRVRAILSWQSVPATPTTVPVWGNRVETHIQLSPGAVSALRPVMDTISGVAVCAIDQASGRTTGAEQPFGGVLTVTGFIPGAPDRAAPPLKYRIQVLPPGGGALDWQTLTNDVSVTVTEQVGSGLPAQYGQVLSVDSDGYYTYLEDPNPLGTGWRRIAGNVLGQWSTAAPMTGLWTIKLDAKDSAGNHYSAQTIHCVDGTLRSSVKVRLDEVAPVTTLAITSFERGGATSPAQPCMKFKVGDTLHGTYSVSDQHFRRFDLFVLPAANAHSGQPVPASGSFPVVPTGGTSGTWTIDTTTMEACGYVLQLVAWDRTIVSGSSVGWRALDKTIGFSIEA